MSLLYTSQKTAQPEIAPPRAVECSADDEKTHAVANTRKQSSGSRCVFRRAVLRQLSKLETGRLTVVDHSGAHEFGQVGQSALEATITINDRRFYRSLVVGGGMGAAEAYIRGYWDSPDLTVAMRMLAQNSEVLSGVEQGVARWLRPVRSVRNWFRRNTRAGSKRNIAAHYDLSNEFFALMLDPTMTYSSGFFTSPESTLEEASIEKYDRVCRKLQVTPEDHIVEIGTGWGGFAEHAARHYGCRVTTTTVSKEQYAYAVQRFRKASLEEKITLLNDDYRDLSGQYDKLVSIEMIEAVGEKFLPAYFAKCSQLLKATGMMLLQAIVIPDHRYEHYRRSVDFIQRYIFPGGFLPSKGRIASCIGRSNEFCLLHSEDFGVHYARTLNLWQRNFRNNIEAIRKLGFDDRFIRTWHYYLCYCEAAFRERQIGVSQIMFAKPMSRRHYLLDDV